MNIWDKLSAVNVENKERFQQIFADTVNRIKNNDFPLQVGETKKQDHYLVIEDNRMDCYFVHIVPNEVYDLFKEMQTLTDQFLGFSVVAGKQDKDIRVSCFGVPCNLLGKALFKKF